MSFHKLGRLLMIAGAFLALASCKDEEETESKPYLSGTLKFDVDAFVRPNQFAKMTPRGLSHQEGKGIGYFWKVTPGMTSSDTTRFEDGLGQDGKESDGTYAYEFKDSLGTYTVTCAAFAKGYTTSYTSIYVTVVQPGLDGSISGTGIQKGDNSIKEAGIDYYYTSHNGLDWMRNNLANPAFGASYANSEAISEVLGRYYSHEEAVNACPDGWRLPTDAEWRELAESLNPESRTEGFNTIPGIAADLMGDVQFNGKTMWEYWPTVGEITNKGKIAVIPGGYSNLGEKKDGKYPTASFTGIYEYAAFWTADTTEDGMAYYRYLYCDQPDMFIGKGDTKTFGAHVRCVRKSEETES